MLPTEESYYAALRALTRPTRALAYPNMLAPMRALLRALGEPQERLTTVVVGGSVGKGTTAAFLAQLLRASGATVGCYSGPHLHCWRERFAIDGVWIAPAEFSALQQRILAALPAYEPSYSTFELNTALALAWFAENKVEFAVLEAGIGGRWDAVNAASQGLALLTPIEVEHANLLGGDLASIAGHKAGLIPSGGRAISAPQAPQVAAILREEAARRGATLDIVGDRSDEPCELARALAAQAFRLLRPGRALPAVEWAAPPGRYEWLEQGSRRWLLDGGHTPRAGEQLARILAGEGCDSVLIVLAMLRDKDARAFVAPLIAAPHSFLLTSTPGNRSLAPQELQVRAEIQKAAVNLLPEPAAAIQHAQQTSAELRVVTGSLRLVAIAREELGLISAALREEARRTRAILAGAWKP